MKTLLAIAASLAISLSAHAAGFVSQSFIVPDIQSVNVTNLVGVTNLTTTGALSAGYGTNITGTIYTNYTGTRVIHDGTSGTVGNKALLKDVDLWRAADGSSPVTYFSDTANVNATNSTFANIFIRLVGGSGANAAVTFVFAPLPDGVNEGSDTLSVAVTATTTTPVTSFTRFPGYRWPGVGKFRLKSITNADTDASSQVTVLNCSINGFVP